MIYDSLIIGAGLGGLSCAAKLAGTGKKVLVLEKDHHIGGTSYIFWRKGFGFPMGPLGFSFPGRISSFLAGVGIDTPLDFKRNHFQLVAPGFEIIYSSPLEKIKNDLKIAFPGESRGLEAFFGELQDIISLTQDIDCWHPDYLVGKARDQALAGLDQPTCQKIDRIRSLSVISCREVLDRHLSDRRLKNFLGTQGTSEPEMSLLNLAFMWNIMSGEGIWFPSCGIHGLSDMLKWVVLRHGGEIRLDAAVERIIVENGKAVGAAAAGGKVFRSGWVVSSADYKTTFLQLVGRDDIPPDFRGRLARIPYTGSEFCIYAGLDPRKVDFSRMRATHLFFRDQIKLENQEPTSYEDFANREVEICLWSDNAPRLVPSGKASLVLRAGFPHSHFAPFRIGEKSRRQGYREYKADLALKLLEVVDHILPGLRSAIEVLEIATPLTYQDWGNRFEGSIAGWTWGLQDEQGGGKKLLIETPIKGLLMSGIYAASELYLGGVPTAIHTADQAAGVILRNVG